MISSLVATLLLLLFLCQNAIIGQSFCCKATQTPIKTTQLTYKRGDFIITSISDTSSRLRLSSQASPTEVNWRGSSLCESSLENDIQEENVRLNGPDQRWEETYSLLQQYYELKGHSRVPNEYKTNCGTWLGDWLVRQKQFHRAGTLKAERWERLQELGVSHLTRSEERWEEMYNLLLQFKEREGHLQVRQKHVEDGEKLGLWLAEQRKSRKKGVLNAYREERLEEYFRTWVPERPGTGPEPNDELWGEKFDLLLQFQAREGHLDVPSNHREDGKNLGMWLSAQRYLQKKGALDSHRK